MLIGYQYKRGYDFYGDYALVQDFNNNYYFIDRANNKKMDIRGDELGPKLSFNYLKYGIYQMEDENTHIYSIFYDINLNKIENFDEEKYKKAFYLNEEVNTFEEILKKYGYKLENEIIYKDDKELLKVDPYLEGFSNTFDIDMINYLIEYKNIFPIAISSLEKTQVIDLISGKKIIDVPRKYMTYGKMFYKGLFMEYGIPLMSNEEHVYSFYNNNLIDIPEELEDLNQGKTYYFLKDKKAEKEGKTRYVYFNYLNEQIYETFEKPVIY